MGTTDGNGIYFYADTDSVSPLQTTLNVGQTSVTNAITAVSAPLNAWTAYTPTLTGFAGTISYARYKLNGKTINVQVMINLTSAASAVMKVSTPVTPRTGYPAGLAIGTVQGAHGASAVLSAVEIDTGAFTFRSSSTTLWSNGYPYAWASGDWLSFTVEYEAV